jgi:hypothetical protein
MHPPRDKYNEHRVASRHGAPDDLAGIRRSGNHRDAPLQRLELPNAVLAAHADHFVAAI